MVFIKCELRKIEWEVAEYERIDKWCSFSLCFRVTTVRSRSSFFVCVCWTNRSKVNGIEAISYYCSELWGLWRNWGLVMQGGTISDVKKKWELCWLWNCYVLIGHILFPCWSKCLTSVWRSLLLSWNGISRLHRAVISAVKRYKPIGRVPCSCCYKMIVSF